jgi:hypothetical protein
MVWESYYWKLRLKKLASEIEVLADQPDASDLDTSNLEIAVFTGFFLIRKLIEAQTKLSPETENQSVKCRTSFKREGSPRVDVLNRFDTHELYDLDAFQDGARTLRGTCNLFMHSVFLWMVYDIEGHIDGEGTVTGVHLTSDYEKENVIYWFDLSDILRVFATVWNDDFSKLEIRRDPATGEMKVLKH